MSTMEVLDARTGELVPLETVAAQGTTLFGTHDPNEVVTAATAHAKALAKVVQSQKLYTTIGQSKHVRVEGWQLLGSMTGVFAVGEGEPEPVEIGGVQGFKATVVAMRNGEIVGRATAYCMRDESRWATQPTHAVASMAQTRATSKALKGPLGFIVKLAGYEATPAEEMPTAENTSSSEAKATPAQVKQINELIGELTAQHVLEPDALAVAMSKEYGSPLPSALSKKQAADFIGRLKAKGSDGNA